MIGRRKRIDSEDSDREGDSYEDDSSASNSSGILSDDDNHLSSDDDVQNEEVAEIDEFLEQNLIVSEEKNTSNVQNQQTQEVNIQQQESQQGENKQQNQVSDKQSKRKRDRRRRRDRRNKRKKIKEDDSLDRDQKPANRKSKRSRRRRRNRRQNSIERDGIENQISADEKKSLAGRRNKRKKLVKQYVPKNQATESVQEEQPPAKTDNRRYNNGPRQYNRGGVGGGFKRSKIRYSQKHISAFNTDGNRGGRRGGGYRGGGTGGRGRRKGGKRHGPQNKYGSPYMDMYPAQSFAPEMAYPEMMPLQQPPFGYFPPPSFDPESIKSRMNVNATEFTLPSSSSGSNGTQQSHPNTAEQGSDQV